MEAPIRAQTCSRELKFPFSAANSVDELFDIFLGQLDAIDCSEFDDYWRHRFYVPQFQFSICFVIDFTFFFVLFPWHSEFENIELCQRIVRNRSVLLQLASYKVRWSACSKDINRKNACCGTTLISTSCPPSAPECFPFYECLSLLNFPDVHCLENVRFAIAADGQSSLSGAPTWMLCSALFYRGPRLAAAA